MRIVNVMLSILVIGCTSTGKEQYFFDPLIESESVVIYLSKYSLDSVPAEIGRLQKARSLYISRDSAGGWTIHPPLNELEEMTETPPFRQLPDEITDLTDLTSLTLVGLDLSTLPDNFQKLQNLDTLNLSFNKLTISKEIEKLKGLKHLRYLELVGNQVDSADVVELKRANPELVVDTGGQ
jgi:Leucine-rich repeat (LRR) protein